MRVRLTFSQSLPTLRSADGTLLRGPFKRIELTERYLQHARLGSMDVELLEATEFAEVCESTGQASVAVQSVYPAGQKTVLTGRPVSRSCKQFDR